MTYELIISEKPNAAKRIAESLADSKVIKKAEKGVTYYELAHKKKDIVVVCAVGHLYTVAEKVKTFKYPSFDVEWKEANLVSKGAAFQKKYLDVIKKLAKGAKSFTVACDYDIEGEVIGLNCVRIACKQKDAHRMKFSTLTKEDIVEAYEHASPTIDWGLAHAGETRHFLDWMYGINISRALTLAVKSTGSFKLLSTGRVQGPTLKLIYDKEKEIEAFIPVPYWQIVLGIEKNNTKIEALHKTDKFDSDAEAKKCFEKALWKPATLDSVDKKESTMAPPTPFDLGTLQTESYKVFGIKPRDTLSIAQNLYTSGVISYPRTSSQKLPAKLGYQKILKALATNEEYTKNANYLLSLKQLVPNEGKKDDAAHPAIYPTGNKTGKLEEREKKVYDLIVKRFFATFGEPAIREAVTLTIDVGGEPFTATGMRTKVKNWFELYEPYVKLKDEEWPEFTRGENLKIYRLDKIKKETLPPRRYTPASIITELEKRGLGTKSTRAEILESLYSRHYVADESIKMTDMGRSIIETLQKHCPDIIDEALTKHFEDDMEGIIELKTKPEAILDDAKKTLTKILKDFKAKEKNIGEELAKANVETRDKESFIAKCPVCHEGNLRLRFSKKRTRFIACDKYPDCKTSYPVPQSGGIKALEKNCQTCNAPMILALRKARRPQEVCLNMNCSSKKEEGVVDVPDDFKVDHPCPKCGKELIIRHSIYGKFIGCSGYPKCRTIESLKKKTDAVLQPVKSDAIVKTSPEKKKVEDKTVTVNVSKTEFIEQKKTGLAAAKAKTTVKKAKTSKKTAKKKKVSKK